MSPSPESMLREAKENGLDLLDQHEVDQSGWDYLVLHATAVDGARWILRAPRHTDGLYLPAEGRLLDHAYLSPAVVERLLADYERHGGHVWPGIREHIALRAALEPVISGLYGLETGRADLIDKARADLSRAQ